MRTRGMEFRQEEWTARREDTRVYEEEGRKDRRLILETSVNVKGRRASRMRMV